MKTSIKLSLFAAAASLALATLNAQQPTLTATAKPATNTIQDAIQGGKVSLDMRLRYEFVDQAGMPHDANALTLRTRLGYTTAAYCGFDIGVEAENVLAIDDHYYDTITPKPGYPAVMDPEVTEVNQAFVRYTNADAATQVTIGRQRIVLDNTRFVGDVAWRQDNQTFDAIRLQNTSVKNLTLNYAWLWRINRVQGDERDWRANAHVINASYLTGKYGTLTGYGYIFNFRGTNTASSPLATQAGSQTYGASFVGSPAVNKDTKVTYRLEYAWQGDHGNNPAKYDTHYFTSELGAIYTKYGMALGYEQLASDNGQGFRTPLATVHAFNGWSDFLTPVGNIPGGIRDTYVKASATLPANIQLLAFFHNLENDATSRAYGREVDVQLAYRLNKNIAFLVKAAAFDGKNGMADLNKFWVQTEYSF